MTNPEIECPNCAEMARKGIISLEVPCGECMNYGYRPMTDDERDERAEQEDMERNAGNG